jgi:hypothetical protein
MATYLYCVLATGVPETTPVVGVGGVPVRTLKLHRAPDLEAWVATLDRSAFRVTGRALSAQALLHNDVVSAALATGRTPLPTRFGAHFMDDASCVDSLTGHAAQLRANLARLAGTVEMSVLVVPPRAARRADAEPLPSRGDAHAGRRYLELVRQRDRQINAVQHVVTRILNDIRAAVRAITRDEATGRGPTGIVSIAHLLRREDTGSYREAVRGVRLHDEFRIIVAGPRAPYSFVGPTTLLIGHDSGSPSSND